MHPQTELLNKLQARLNLGPTNTARVLGITYVTYAGYRAGRRLIPRYMMRQILLIEMLTPKQLEALLDQTLMEVVDDQD